MFEDTDPSKAIRIRAMEMTIGLTVFGEDGRVEPLPLDKIIPMAREIASFIEGAA